MKYFFKTTLVTTFDFVLLLLLLLVVPAAAAAAAASRARIAMSSAVAPKVVRGSKSRMPYRALEQALHANQRLNGPRAKSGPPNPKILATQDGRLRRTLSAVSISNPQVELMTITEGLASPAKSNLSLSSMGLSPDVLPCMPLAAVGGRSRGQSLCTPRSGGSADSAHGRAASVARPRRTLQYPTPTELLKVDSAAAVLAAAIAAAAADAGFAAAASADAVAAAASPSPAGFASAAAAAATATGTHDSFARSSAQQRLRRRRRWRKNET